MLPVVGILLPGKDANQAKGFSLRSGEQESVESPMSEATLWALFVIVLINVAHSEKSVRLVGRDVPERLNAHVSTATQIVGAAGTPMQRDGITLPARSLTTLISGSYLDEDIDPRPIVQFRAKTGDDRRLRDQVHRQRGLLEHEPAFDRHVAAVGDDDLRRMAALAARTAKFDQLRMPDRKDHRRARECSRSRQRVG